MVRLAGKENLHGGGPALDLSLFRRQINRLSALIAGDDVEFRPENLLHQLGDVVRRRPSAGRAAPGWRRCRADVLDRLVRGVAAHVHLLGPFDRGADPGEFPIIELDLFSPEQLIKIDRRDHHSECQTVRLADAVNIVGCNDAGSPRHILDDNVGVSRDVLGHVGSDNARPEIVEISRRQTHHNPDNLAFVKRIGLGIKGRGRREAQDDE